MSIIVSNLPNDISEAKLDEFFSICGSISNIETINIGTTKKVKLKFNNPKAVETALLLNNEKIFNNTIKIEEESAPPDAKVERRGSLDYQSQSLNEANQARQKSRASSINSNPGVHALSSLPDPEKSSTKPPSYTSSQHAIDEHTKATAALSNPETQDKTDSAQDIIQEEKPKSVILAQYISQGYVLSDKLIQKAIDIDNQRGVSTKFKSFLADLDKKYNITTNINETDKKYNVSENFNTGLNKLDAYFDRLGNSGGVGSRIHGFYTNLVKDTKDVHAEAKRLAELKEQKLGISSTDSTGGFVKK